MTGAAKGIGAATAELFHEGAVDIGVDVAHNTGTVGSYTGIVDVELSV